MGYFNELDEAQITHEMRQLYKDVGFEKCIRALAEIIKCGEILATVILDERKKEL